VVNERYRLISETDLSLFSRISLHLLRFFTYMGGWFVDTFVEYLFRVTIRMLKRRGSTAWPAAKATVTSSACPKAGYGCDVAEVYYTYRIDGELYTGINEKPFVIRNSGENYVSRFAPGTEFTVRVKAKDAAVSLVRDGDQRGSRG
jgi:hypothetical protein